MTISRNPKDIVPGALIVLALATTKEIVCLVLDNVKLNGGIWGIVMAQLASLA